MADRSYGVDLLLRSATFERTSVVSTPLNDLERILVASTPLNNRALGFFDIPA